MTSKMVSKATRLWFYITIESRYFIKEELGKHSRQQQRCSNAQERTMEKKNNGWNYDVKKKQHNREDKVTEGNTMK